MKKLVMFFSRIKITSGLEIIASWLAVGIALAIPLSTSATDMLFILAPLLFWCAGRWREKFNVIWQCRSILLLIFIYLLMVFGASYSIASFTKAGVMLLKNDKFILGALLLPIFVQPKWRNYAMQAFFAALAITLAVALLVKIGLMQSKFDEMLVFKDRIQTSFLLAIGAYFATSYFFFSRPINLFQRCFYGSLAIFCTILLFSIEGRSGYFIFFALLLLLCWNKWKGKSLKYFLIFSLVLVAVVYNFSPVFKERMSEVVENLKAYQSGNNDTSVGQRLQFAKNSLEIVKQHPLLGTGTGSFEQSYLNVINNFQVVTSNPHNEYLNFLVQWGLVGLILLLWMLCLQWRDSYDLPNPMQQIVQGTLAALLLGCLANSWLMDTTESHFYAYFMALAFASQPLPKLLWTCKTVKKQISVE